MGEFQGGQQRENGVQSGCRGVHLETDKGFGPQCPLQKQVNLFDLATFGRIGPGRGVGDEHCVGDEHFFNDAQA